MTAPATPRSRVIVFRSSSGGAGQSTIAAHVALGLARAGRAVLLADMQTPSIATHFLATTAAPTTAPAAPGALGREALPLAPGLWHVPLDPHAPDDAPRFVDHVLQNAAPDTWVLLDLARHIEPAIVSSMAPDVQVMVLRAEPSALLDLGALRGRHDLWFVVNQIDGRSRLSRDIDRVLSALLLERIAARIHYDEAIAEALANRHNVYDAAPDSRAAQALSDLVSLMIEADGAKSPIVASRTER